MTFPPLLAAALLAALSADPLDPPVDAPPADPPAPPAVVAPAPPPPPAPPPIVAPAPAPAVASPAPTPPPAAPAEDFPVTGSPAPDPIVVASAAAPSRPKRTFFGAWGVLGFGEHLSTAITPTDAPYQINEPDSAWGFGIVGEFRPTPEIRIFADGGIHRMKVEVAKPGGYGYDFWVYEQRGYTSTAPLGPFPDGCVYFMDTTMLRAGAAYAMPVGNMSAWVGGTLGLYAWQATYGTPDRKRKYGQVGKTVAGFTLIGGIDLPLGDVAVAGIFADLASPAAEADMEDLFFEGWTFGISHHVMAPYRIGLRFLMPM